MRLLQALFLWLSVMSAIGYPLPSIANSRPIAIPQSITTDEDTSVEIVLEGNDLEDGTNLTYQVTSSATTLKGTLVAVTGRPNVYRYTPNANVNGAASFSFTVRDRASAVSAPATVSINVRPINDAPVAQAQNATLAEDASITLTLRATDVDNTVLTYALATPPSNGTVTLNGAQAVYRPNRDYFGTDSFTFIANDGALNSLPATINLTITPVNDVPVARAQSVTLDEDTSMEITLQGDDVEDGTNLTYQVTSSATTLKGTLVAVTGRPNVYRYTPNANVNGAASFSFTVRDRANAISAPATVSINVRPVNDAPVAQAQNVTLAEDASITLTLSATDVDNTVLTYALATPPSNGTVTLNGAQAIYRPNRDYFGTDSFTFIANDGELNSLPATINLTITPVNDAPVARAQSVTLDEDTSMEITLQGDDVEDGTNLIYQVTSSATALKGTLVAVTGRPNVYRYTPNANVNGAAAFSFTVRDRANAVSAPATVSINIRSVNDAPVAQAQNVTLAEDASITLTLRATDVDNTVLTYALATPPSNGTVTLNGAQAVYRPNRDYFGTDSFTFTANDGELNSLPATINLTITPVNDAPVAIAQTVTLSSRQQTTIILQGTDVENDPLTYLLTTPNPQGVLVRPTGFGTVAGVNTLLYTPKAGVNSDEIWFQVRDRALTSAKAKVTITFQEQVFNDPALLRCYGNTPPVWETLTTFTCDGVDLSTANLAQLANLPNLRTLSLTNAKLSNISALANLTQLTSLNLGFNKITNISALAGMTQLQSLNLGFNAISDITPLTNLNALRELYLEANNISSISPLAGKTALTKLALDANTISDISALNGLTALTHVGLGYNRLTTTAALANKPLQVLVLDANHLTSLSSLPKPTSLRELYLRGNGTTATTVLSDITPLNSGLTNLNVLELGFNDISNAAPLANLTALTRLGLENNSLTTLSSLSALTNVQTLDVENNLLATTAGINAMTGLNGLVRIDNNRLLDANGLSTAGGSKSLQLTLGDNCLSAVTLPSRIKVVNLPWQFPSSRCGSTAPLAIGKHVEILQNTPTTIALDVSDHLGNAISASNGVTYQLTSTNVSGGTLNTSGLASGSVSFTPSSANGGYLGDAGSFTFTATRNGQVSAPATVSLRVIHPILSTCFGGSIPSEAALRNASSFECAGKSLSTISVLKHYFPSIQTLILENNQIEDISELNSTNFPNLIRLNLSKNPLDMGDFTALGNQLPSLIMLFLDDAQLDNDDLTALFGTAASPKLTGIQYLALRNNSISDITPLLHLNNLSTLLLTGNQIQDVSALSPAAPAAVPLPALAEFTISANRLSTLSLARLASLNTLEANRNCLSAAPVVRTTTPLPSVSWTGQRALVNGVCPPAP